MASQFFYRVPTIIREKENRWRSHGMFYSFMVSGEAAAKLIVRPLEQECEERLQGLARAILGKTSPDLIELGVPDKPYRFVDGSYLLRGISVPGNACDLFLEVSDLEDLLRFKEEGGKSGSDVLPVDFANYTVHNVDLYDQALALRELFIAWTDSVALVLRD